jgi:hypothetical protein
MKKRMKKKRERLRSFKERERELPCLFSFAVPSRNTKHKQTWQHDKVKEEEEEEEGGRAIIL